MTDKLRAAAEHFIVAWDSLTTVDLALAEPFVEALRQALDELEELPPVKSYCGGKPNYCETDEKEIYQLWRESESYQVPMTEEGEKLAQHRYRGFKKGYMVRREWVGLTDDEITEVGKSTVEGKYMLPHSFARAIEAKLKSKNGF